MKKLLAILLTVILSLSATAAFADTITIGVPNDPTNLARALMLLDYKGVIKLEEGVGIEATVRNIEKYCYDVELVEVEAVQLPVQLPDLDYAVINSNYALGAELNPVEDGLAVEDAFGAYGNILAVKADRAEEPKLLALKAALESQQVVDFIKESYAGSVVSTVLEITDGYNAAIDYEALKGEKITVAASPVPHAEILNFVKDILAAKDIELEVIEYTDYVQPNMVVDAGEVDANYFQHLPYLNDFNTENGTNLVSIADIHVEPMALYSIQHKTAENIGIVKE